MRKLQVSHYLAKTFLVLVLLVKVGIAAQLDPAAAIVETDLDNGPKPAAGALLQPADAALAEPEKVPLEERLTPQQLIDLEDETEVVAALLADPAAFQHYLIEIVLPVADLSQVTAATTKTHDGFNGNSRIVHIDLPRGEKRVYHISPPRYGWACG